jgi:hypothetical protein
MHDYPPLPLGIFGMSEFTVVGIPSIGAICFIYYRSTLSYIYYYDMIMANPRGTF